MCIQPWYGWPSSTCVIYKLKCSTVDEVCWQSDWFAVQSPEFVAMLQTEVTLILDKLEFPYETV